MYGIEGKRKIHRTAKQSWAIGEIVNVGFLKGLMVLKKEPTPGDWLPDAYILKARTGATYRFVPHNGLERLS